MTLDEALKRIRQLEGERDDWRAAFSVHHHNTSAIQDMRARLANVEQHMASLLEKRDE